VKAILAVSVIVAFLRVGDVAAAGDPDAGKTKAAVCIGCHGIDGIGTSPLWPNLKGQKRAYLVKQLKAFRGGSRTDSTMSTMAQPLSDEDIDNLAAYYSGL